MSSAARSTGRSTAGSTAESTAPPAAWSAALPAAWSAAPPAAWSAARSTRPADPEIAPVPDAELRSALGAALDSAVEAPLGIAPALRQPGCRRLRLLPGGGAELHATPSGCPTADPIGRRRAIAGGAALRNLELAVAGLGHEPAVRPLPDPADPLHLATVTVGAARDPDDADLRLTSEMARRPRPPAPVAERHPVEPWLARWLRRAAAGHERVHALPLEGDRLRTVGTVLAAALSHRRCGEDHLDDVEQWLTTGDRGTPRGDRAAIIDQLERGVLILVTTDADRPLDWLQAGRSLQNAWLTAGSLGLVGSAVGGVLDAPGVRSALAMRLRLAGCPQLLLRAGWPRTAQSPAH